MKHVGVLGHVKEVPIEAAHLLMSISDLVWLFAPRRPHWHTSHLMLVARHFGVSAEPSPFETARRYEQGLLEDVLSHLQGHPTHRFMVLYRVSCEPAGWVCLMPEQQMGKVNDILQCYHLHMEPADPAEVLQ